MARTSRETTGPVRLTQAGTEFRQPGCSAWRGTQLRRSSGPSPARAHRTQQDIVVDGGCPEPTRLHPPEITPAARILQLAAEHDAEPDQQAAD
jgi:hypothetical protein